MVTATNAEAVDTMIAALGDRLEDEHAALVAMARSLAGAVDADRCAHCSAHGQNAALWKEYRATVTALSEVGADGDDDDTLAFRVSIQTPMRPPVGDTP